jgi:NADH dehydrogenase
MIIVTGGTGFVGTAVCRALRDKGRMVTAVSRTRKPRPIIKTGGGIEFRTASVLDPASLDAAFKGAVAVVHLVGIIFQSRGATFEKIHVEGTRNVLDAAKRAGAKRFLHMSALGASASAPTAYWRTKGQAEDLVKASGLDWTIFRPSIIFGEDDDFVNRFASMARYLPFMPVIGSGKTRMQPIWVDDVAAAFAHALEDDRTIGQSYDLGGPKKMTILEILDVVMHTIGKRRPRLHIPAPIMSLQAGLLERVFKQPPVTREQIKMLAYDNVCATETPRDLFPLRMLSLEEGARYYL